MPAAVAVAASTALEILRHQPELPVRARANAARLAHGLGLPEPAAAIVPIIAGESEEALRLSNALLASGILVPAIRPPSVPPGTARLRATVMATHTVEHIDTFVDAFTRARVPA